MHRILIYKYLTVTSIRIVKKCEKRKLVMNCGRGLKTGHEMWAGLKSKVSGT